MRVTTENTEYTEREIRNRQINFDDFFTQCLLCPQWLFLILPE
jgi:hypothetical protein